MRIERYLEKINQEMISTPKVSRKSIVEGCCIYVSWKKSCCILDFSFVSPQDYVSTPIPLHWMMRSEADGGLLWNPKSGEVFKLDEEAYSVMVELQNGKTERAIAKELHLKPDQVKAFTEKILEIQS